MSKPLCPVCSRPLVGRSDKKYCDDHCRYLANNKHKIESEKPILDVNKTLRRNRSILKKLCPFGKAVIRKEVLDTLGYDVKVFSSLFVTSKREVYYICYDYAFTPLLENNVKKALIVSKQDYMNMWDPWRFVNKK